MAGNAHGAQLRGGGCSRCTVGDAERVDEFVGAGARGLEAAFQVLFGGVQVGADGGAADAEVLGRSLGIGASLDPGSQGLVHGAVRAELQGLEEGVGPSDGRFARDPTSLPEGVGPLSVERRGPSASSVGPPGVVWQEAPA